MHKFQYIRLQNTETTYDNNNNVFVYFNRQAIESSINVWTITWHLCIYFL